MANRKEQLGSWEARKPERPLVSEPYSFPAEGGFTLIEVLVAMSIFAIAVLGLAIGATSVMRANQTGLYTTIATNLAQDRLEELKSRTPANINTTGSPESVPGSNVPVTFTRSWTVDAAGVNGCPSVTGLTCINVTVSWTDYTSHSVTVSSAVKTS